MDTWSRPGKQIPLGLELMRERNIPVNSFLAPNDYLLTFVNILRGTAGEKSDLGDVRARSLGVAGEGRGDRGRF